MDGYDATTYGERWVDVYDDWYDDPSETAAIVAFVTTRADAPDRSPGLGPIVELGVGTGRLALALAERGYDVRGIDASPAMVARLRAKPGGERVPVTIGDMADVIVPRAVRAETGELDETDPDDLAGLSELPDPDADGACRGVLVAANTFFGLTTDADQRRCLARVHDVLAPGGWLIVAAFVPDERLDRGRGSTVGVRSMTADQVVLTADRYDAETQTISGQYIDISATGITLRPFHIRYVRPKQLDELAAAAGLRLAERHGGWDGRPFDNDAAMHVSVYRR